MRWMVMIMAATIGAAAVAHAQPRAPGPGHPPCCAQGGPGRGPGCLLSGKADASVEETAEGAVIRLRARDPSRVEEVRGLAARMAECVGAQAPAPAPQP